MNGWLVLFSLSKLNLTLSSYLLRSGRIQFQSFWARISFPSSGFKNTLEVYMAFTEWGITPQCLPSLQLSILYMRLLGTVLHHLAGDGAKGRLREILSADPSTQHRLRLSVSNSLCNSQTSFRIWCFVHISNRSLSFMETPQNSTNPVSLSLRKGKSILWLRVNPFHFLEAQHRPLSMNLWAQTESRVLFCRCFTISAFDPDT